MNNSDILTVIAECGVALAGFASLITVLGSSQRALDFTRLLGMVKYGLTAAGFALLPFAPDSLGMTQESVWKVSAGLFFIVHTYAVVIAWLRLADLRRSGTLQSFQRTRVGFYTYPAGLTSIIVLLLALLAPFEANLLSGLYVCALLIVLSCAGALFLSLFGEFVADRIAARQNVKSNNSNQ